MHSLELLARDGLILRERLVDVNDDGREDQEEEAEAEDDDIPDRDGGGGVAAKVGHLLFPVGVEVEGVRALRSHDHAAVLAMGKH